MSIGAIQQSAENGNLVIVLGAGASIALTSKSKLGMSWPALVQSALDYGKDRGLVNGAQYDRYVGALASDDIDDLLGVAEFVGRKLDAPSGDTYARWLRSVFEQWSPDEGGMLTALRTCGRKRIPIATLNYDTLAESATGLPGIDFDNTSQMMAWLRKERQGVLHLHGEWAKPQSCVFGIRDYQATLNDEIRQHVQRSLGSLNRLLFIGCGDTFLDPNFTALIQWLRANIGSGAPEHFALVRNEEVASRLVDPAWRGFVEPLGYGDHHGDLPQFMLKCFPTKLSTAAKVARAELTSAKQDAIIDAYKGFLIRDCGEMTIEGMRADLETAQRKFDIEKLFVPLEVLSFPPEISTADANREAKLQNWREKNAKPISFSDAFANNKHLALLALPGGGKTLLLKRLAVAYADSRRRELGPDKLPDLDLIPLMIRCREWKDHIRQPFPTLLRSIAAITGEVRIDGLADALEKPLKAGRILLLVDGLDEIHDDSDRTIFVENLEKFLGSYPKIRLLVTSREAGFDLIAPCLVRFCRKFRIAPLSKDAIRNLSEHWHRLMIGGTPEASSEAQSVSNSLITNDALRRLAENPLLLTMLLVVKHGAGRLPPDRVSLYDRAIEVLLDTWNIKGHDALNAKEAVPQLACLAYELMRRGVQTATEQEILHILESARATLPMVGRYAKDSPHDFLKRVELRSSLLLEGGHTAEGSKTVPFYQFRHLTFQEYLAAVAAVDGYTLAASQPPSLIGAIGDNLLSDEWKEIIPMAAVLARFQADPLLRALTDAAGAERDQYASASQTDPNKQFLDSNPPPAVSRLLQAMVEEAVFSSETLVEACAIVTLFTQSHRSVDSISVLGRGPYAPDLKAAALEHYVNESFIHRSWIISTIAVLEGVSRTTAFWSDDASEFELLASLDTSEMRLKVQAILRIGGGFWLHRAQSAASRSQPIYEALEEALFDNRRPVYNAAIWTWGFWRHLRNGKQTEQPRPIVLNRIIDLFLENYGDPENSVDFILQEIGPVTRRESGLILSERHRALFREIYDIALREPPTRDTNRQAVIRTAYMLPDYYSDEEVIELINKSALSEYSQKSIADILNGLGLSTKKGRKKIARPRKSLSDNNMTAD